MSQPVPPFAIQQRPWGTVSIVVIVLLALLIIFAMPYIMQTLSFITSTTNDLVSSTPSPQVAWILALYNVLYVPYSWLYTILTNQYSVAALIVLYMVVLAFVYYWYWRGQTIGG